MRHGLAVNVSNFLLNLLKHCAHETQMGRDNSIAHHSLVKFLIKHSLRDVSPLSWKKFVAHNGLQPPKPPRGLPTQHKKKKKRVESTSRELEQESSAPTTLRPVASTLEPSTQVQTRSTSRKEKWKTKVGESSRAEQTPESNPHVQNRNVLLHSFLQHLPL